MSAPNPPTPPRGGKNDESEAADHHGKRPRLIPDSDAPEGADRSSNESSSTVIAGGNNGVVVSSAMSGQQVIGHVCSECGKIFIRWKALCGHMRCHPERNWRGVTPPSQRMQIEHQGRPLHEVAASLIILAASGGGDAVGEDAAGLGAGGEAKGGGGEESGHFLCTGCNRVFASRQALGGHRATHKNVKGCCAIARDVGESSNPREKNEKEGGEEKIREVGKKEEEKEKWGGGGVGGEGGPRCGICGREFVNTQGLGAHRRVHEKERNRREGVGSSSTGKGGGCGLDLNLPAPEDEDGDDEEEDGKNGRRPLKFDLNK